VQHATGDPSHQFWLRRSESRFRSRLVAQCLLGAHGTVNTYDAQNRLLSAETGTMVMFRASGFSS